MSHYPSPNTPRKPYLTWLLAFWVVLIVLGLIIWFLPKAPGGRIPPTAARSVDTTPAQDTATPRPVIPAASR